MHTPRGTKPLCVERAGCRMRTTVLSSVCVGTLFTTKSLNAIFSCKTYRILLTLWRSPFNLKRRWVAADPDPAVSALHYSVRLSVSLHCQASFPSWLCLPWHMSATSGWSMRRWWTSPGRGGQSATSGCTPWPGRGLHCWAGTATRWRSTSWAAPSTGRLRTPMMPPSSSSSCWPVSLCLWASWSTATGTSSIQYKW